MGDREERAAEVQNELKVVSVESLSEENRSWDTSRPEPPATKMGHSACRYQAQGNCPDTQPHTRYLKERRI